jgi:uncharacterized damage-inducible protein DinB
MSDGSPLLESLAASRARLLHAIAGVSEEQFKRRPRAEDGSPQWCIAEVLAHLLASERLYARRIALALERDGQPVEARTHEEREAEARAGRAAPVPMLIHGLLAARRELEKPAERATRLEDGLGRSVNIAGERRETVIGMIEGVIAHEAEHAGQIERLRPAVGAPPDSMLR